MARVSGEGVGKKGFPSFPFPSPSFIFCLSFHFSRGQNRESHSSVFLCSETARKRLLRRLTSCSIVTTVRRFCSHERIWVLEQYMYGLPKYLIQRLQAVQNCAACLVTCKPRNARATPILRELHWLPVESRIIFIISL